MPLSNRKKKTNGIYWSLEELSNNITFFALFNSIFNDINIGNVFSLVIPFLLTKTEIRDDIDDLLTEKHARYFDSLLYS